jgi:hypothetical protein
MRTHRSPLKCDQASLTRLITRDPRTRPASSANAVFWQSQPDFVIYVRSDVLALLARWTVAYGFLYSGLIKLTGPSRPLPMWPSRLRNTWAPRILGAFEGYAFGPLSILGLPRHRTVHEGSAGTYLLRSKNLNTVRELLGHRTVPKIRRAAVEGLLSLQRDPTSLSTPSALCSGANAHSAVSSRS